MLEGEGKVRLGSDMGSGKNKWLGWVGPVAWLRWPSRFWKASQSLSVRLSELLTSLSAGYLGQIYQFSCCLSSDPCTLGSRVVFTVSQVFHFPASSSWKPQIKNTFALDNSYCICKSFFLFLLSQSKYLVMVGRRGQVLGWKHILSVAWCIINCLVLFVLTLNHQ